MVLIHPPFGQHVPVAALRVGQQEVLPVVVVGREDVQPPVAVSIDDAKSKMCGIEGMGGVCMANHLPSPANIRVTCGLRSFLAV